MTYMYKQKGWRENTRVGAFKWEDYDRMQMAVKQLCVRAVSYMSVDLTTNDIMRLFVDPEHHNLVRDAVRVLKISPAKFFVTRFARDSDPQNVRLEVNLKPTPEAQWAAPGYLGQRVYDHPEAEAKLADWVKARIAIGYEFSLVNEVLCSLNQLCADENTVRFFWSGIIGLATVGGRDALADRVRECKPVRCLPALPTALCDELERTRTTIVKAMMLPDTAPDPQEVHLCMDVSPLRKKSPWNGNSMEAM